MVLLLGMRRQMRWIETFFFSFRIKLWKKLKKEYDIYCYGFVINYRVNFEWNRIEKLQVNYRE